MKCGSKEDGMMGSAGTRRLAALLAAGLGIACTPRVQIEPPKEPIVINLNVKIEQEVRVRVDRDLDELIAQDEDLFGTDADKDTGGKP
jgi:hypothetical protein